MSKEFYPQRHTNWLFSVIQKTSLKRSKNLKEIAKSLFALSIKKNKEINVSWLNYLSISIQSITFNILPALHLCSSVKASVIFKKFPYNYSLRLGDFLP